MGQTYGTITTGSDTLAAGITALAARTDTLRTTFSGASSPGTPVEGQTWLDTSATPHLLKAYIDVGAGDAWTVIGPVAKLNSDINLDASAGDTRATCKALLGACLEVRGAHVAAGAGNIGYIYVLTGDGEVYILDNTVAGVRKALLSIVDSVSKDTVEIDLTSATLGATPATAWTAGTSPAARGYLFDATGESMTLQCVVPANYSADADLTLETYWVLDTAETAADDIDVDCNWVSVTVGTDSVNRTSTAATAGATDIGAVNGQYAAHKVSITIDYNDASNPVAAGDLLLMEINRKTMGGAGFCAGTALVAARLTYPQAPRHARA